ncbi:Crp/Fnr family transcriptional regulator [Acidovorax sp.]|uniref:Crp/Fnr family transcriptional regulator n=1 Tax=Acidovorax sp. TaxID=1872122 RepID=UPI002ACED418|nr:Crp/Fnr family transcriptional regulator [Acidovorax sp.]MDZ7863116.1 Crp/Fnr family transcriptional regulator [Acidovorax sp.]
MKPATRSLSEPPQPVLLSTPPEIDGKPPELLEHLEPATRAAVQALGSARGYRGGEVLFRQGDVHDGIHLIRSGTIKSFYVSEDGRELTLGYWTAGHYVGAPQLFGGGRHAWTSVAMAPSRCLWLPGPELRALSRQHADLALALTDALVHKSQCYCALLQLLATHSMRVRLARLLAMLAARPIARPALIDLSHTELAGMIGSTRQWVSLSLARFEGEALLDRLPDGTYLVRDPKALGAVR